MKKIILVWSVLFLNSYVLIAQTGTLRMTFTGVVGQSLTVKLAAKNGQTGNAEIDFGDGVLQSMAVTTNNSTSTAANLTGNILGTGVVKIYYPVDKKLFWVNLDNMALTGADLTKNPDLEQLSMSATSVSNATKFYNIDFSNNPLLTFVNMRYNPNLNSLNVSNAINMGTLQLGNCTSLSSLNITNCNNLTALELINSPAIGSVDVTGKTKLTTLTLNNIGLTNLNVTSCTNLTYLVVPNNSLTSLNVENNTKLGSATALTAAIDISNNHFSTIELNGFFNQIPSISTDRTLKLVNNPGAAASNTVIATDKGWKTDIVGDPALPLTLLSFTGELKKNITEYVSLNWKTTEEKNTKVFLIERAANDGVFKEIGKIDAQNILGINDYSYTDNNLLIGVSYYRLKQIDVDGTFTYSNILKIENSDKPFVNVYPVPAKEGKLFVEYPLVQSKNASIEIYSMVGKKVYTLGLSLNSKASSIDVSALASSNYILVYKSENQAISKKIIIQ